MITKFWFLFLWRKWAGSSVSSRTRERFSLPPSDPQSAPQRRPQAPHGSPPERDAEAKLTAASEPYLIGQLENRHLWVSRCSSARSRSGGPARGDAALRHSASPAGLRAPGPGPQRRLGATQAGCCDEEGRAGLHGHQPRSTDAICGAARVAGRRRGGTGLSRCREQPASTAAAGRSCRAGVGAGQRPRKPASFPGCSQRAPGSSRLKQSHRKSPRPPVRCRSRASSAAAPAGAAHCRPQRPREELQQRRRCPAATRKESVISGHCNHGDK